MSPRVRRPTTATVLALLLATALSMVFGELVPKNLAIADPLRTARARRLAAERVRARRSAG